MHCDAIRCGVKFFQVPLEEFDQQCRVKRQMLDFADSSGIIIAQGMG